MRNKGNLSSTKITSTKILLTTLNVCLDILPFRERKKLHSFAISFITLKWIFTCLNAYSCIDLIHGDKTPFSIYIEFFFLSFFPFFVIIRHNTTASYSPNNRRKWLLRNEIYLNLFIQRFWHPYQTSFTPPKCESKMRKEKKKFFVEENVAKRFHCRCDKESIENKFATIIKYKESFHWEVGLSKVLAKADVTATHTHPHIHTGKCWLATLIF